MKISEKDFGKGYHLITLENEHGFHLSVSDLGARIVHLGKDTELILGFDSAEEYLEKDPYIGASIGRTAGRIQHGRFTLAGKNYQVETDPATGHTLHGGPTSFEAKKWDYTIENGEEEASVIFKTLSPDGEHDFPGNLTIEVRYTLTNDNVWRLTTKGTTDQLTLFNPTNHVYFNLTGDPAQPIDDHTLWLNSDHFAPVGTDVLPTGEIKDSTGTAFDFQTPRKLGDAFATSDEQKDQFGGFDHPFFLKEHTVETPAAKLTSPDGSVEVEMRTDASSVVIFSANFGEDGPEMRGSKLVNHGGITFETQVAPGAEQFPDFGSIAIAPMQPFESTTEFKIKLKEAN
ncbi:MAG: aldose epimerase family protein [Enterococcus viikkiensis]|uniref:Aldose 1-epimerase n=1 Tax=Enterococcus viikkiensis TaxID=930854 RepID=A0ABU3FLP5_9ENTE|nr:aldose epimerase family protein [Enterococcus viikkiensis]MDT2826894.1 galactose mutarotase [Enterococcus viikkiensis]